MCLDAVALEQVLEPNDVEEVLIGPDCYGWKLECLLINVVKIKLGMILLKIR